jgi:hypothetical protein
MPTYQLLFFRGYHLARWEPIEAETPLEAVQEAARRNSDDLVELWAESGRIASFRPVGGSRR